MAELTNTQRDLQLAKSALSDSQAETTRLQAELLQARIEQKDLCSHNSHLETIVSDLQDQLGQLLNENQTLQERLADVDERNTQLFSQLERNLTERVKEHNSKVSRFGDVSPTSLSQPAFNMTPPLHRNRSPLLDRSLERLRQNTPTPERLSPIPLKLTQIVEDTDEVISSQYAEPNPDEFPQRPEGLADTFRTISSASATGTHINSLLHDLNQ